jgi:hypothetical protein
MNTLYHISKSLKTIFWVEMLKFFDEDADPGIFLTLDPGWNKFGSCIRDDQNDLDNPEDGLDGKVAEDCPHGNLAIRPLPTLPIKGKYLSFLWIRI